MSEDLSLYDRLSNRLQRFTPREQRLLGVMGLVLGCGLLLVVGYIFASTASQVREDNDERRRVLQMLRMQSGDFMAGLERNRRDQEKLNNNDLRLTTFIESRAATNGISFPSNFSDREVPGPDGVTSYQTTADFASLELAEVATLLNAFDSTQELVYIQDISISPARAREGGLFTKITLVTFRRGGM